MTAIDAIDAFRVSARQDDPDDGQHDRDERVQHDHHAAAGGDALAAAEPAPHREHVADDRRRTQPVAGRAAADEQAEPGRERALDGVEHEHPDALAPAERAA